MRTNATFAALMMLLACQERGGASGRAAASPPSSIPSAIPSVVGAPPPAARTEVAPSDPRQRAIEHLIAAAHADLRPPEAFASGQLRDEAVLVGVKRQLVAAQKPEEAVAEALALAGTPESEAALTAWVIGPSNNLSHRAIALKRLLRSPKPDYLPVFEAVLLSSEFAGLILQGTAPQGLVNGALKATFVQCSAYCATLGAIRKLHLPQADSIIQQIATDRARSGPSPETLRAFTCEEGAHVVPDVAAALASERLWALSTLGDLELLRTIVDDPSESKLIRDWGRRMLEKRAISLHGARGAGDEPSPSVAAPCTLR